MTDIFLYQKYERFLQYDLEYFDLRDRLMILMQNLYINPSFNV